MWKEYAVLILVRHTAVTLLDGAPPDEWPASPAGVAEAERLATAPLFGNVRIVASSPERKALETARPLARRLGLELVVEPDLREVARPAGPIVSQDEISRRVRTYMSDGLRGWEPCAEAEARVRGCVARLQLHADTVVVVSHGLLLTLLRGDDQGLWETIPLPGVAIAIDGAFGPWLSTDEALALPAHSK